MSANLYAVVELLRGAMPRGRWRVAAASGVSPSNLSRWVVSPIRRRDVAELLRVTDALGLDRARVLQAVYAEALGWLEREATPDAA